jgi:hypothetical protein
VRPGGRIALLDVGIRSNKLIRWGKHLLRQGCPRSALLSDGAAYRYLPKSVAYLPTAPEMVVRCSTAPDSTVLTRPRRPRTGLTQLLSRHPMIAHTTPLGRRRPQRRARSDGYLFVREGSASRRGASPRGVPIDEAIAFLAAIEHVDDAGATNGRSRSERCRSCPARRQSSWCPRSGRQGCAAAWVT